MFFILLVCLIQIPFISNSFSQADSLRMERARQRKGVWRREREEEETRNKERGEEGEEQEGKGGEEKGEEEEGADDFCLARRDKFTSH